MQDMSHVQRRRGDGEVEPAVGCESSDGLAGSFLLLRRCRCLRLSRRRCRGRVGRRRLREAHEGLLAVGGAGRRRATASTRRVDVAALPTPEASVTQRGAARSRVSQPALPAMQQTVSDWPLS